MIPAPKTLTCPKCKRTTRRKPNRHEPAWTGPADVVQAARADGTCGRCLDATKRTRPKYTHKRFENMYEPTEEEILERIRREVAAYFADRRSRGIDPDGNADLDKMFEDDVKTGAWKLPRNLARRSHATQRVAAGLPAQRPTAAVK